MAGTWTLRGFALETLLGTGGHAEVWRARIVATGQPVALKRLQVGDREQAARAHAEAAKLAVLDHPHLVRLHASVPMGDAMVLVLDLADGGSLAQLLAARTRLTPGEVITAIAPVAAAVAYLHGVEVVHGDVSAANVLFTAAGNALLADLGVARLIGDAADAQSTPAYVDPVVAVGGVPGPAGDVFMLGAIALHALTGHPPWPGASATESLARACRAEQPDFAGQLAAAGVATPMAAVVARALEADPRRRGTAADFALDLRGSGTPVAVELGAGRPAPAVRAEGAARPYGARHAAVPVKVLRRGRTPVAGGVGGGDTPGGGTVAAAGMSARDRVAARSRAAAANRARPAFERPGAPATPGGPVPPGGAVPSGRQPPTSAVGPLPRPSLPRSARARPTTRRAAARRRRVPVAILCCAAAVLLAAFATGGYWWTHRAAGAVRVRAAARVDHRATASKPVPSAARPGGTSGWAGRLVALDAVRARAFAARDPHLLAAVYSSATLVAADTALLERIVPPGCGLHGARTRYQGLRVMQRGPHSARLVARATLPRSRLTCHGRAVGAAAAVGPVRMHVTLTSTAAGVRIAAQRRV